MLSFRSSLLYLFIYFIFDCAESSLLCVGFFLLAESGGSFLIVVHGLLIGTASLVAEQSPSA